MKYRLKISKTVQRDFFEAVSISSNTSWEEIAELCGVSARTVRDWVRAKYFAPRDQYFLLSKKFSVPFPKRFKLLNQFWYVTKGAKKGALKRQELYGLLGSKESRQKGGIISQKNRRINPEKYRLLGCIVRKKFQTPKFSRELAELIGIILGDGTISNYQVRITLDKRVDKEYALFVSKLIGKVFGEKPSWVERDDNTINLTLSGAGLVEIFEKLGLKRGDKIKNQVGFPKWILCKKFYRIACIRGLFDTDGGLYFHRHSKWEDKRPYIGWCFTSFSRFLLKDFYETLQISGLSSKKVSNEHLYMYSVENIVRYLQVIGTSNPKNLKKFRYYISMRKYAKAISDKYKLKLWRGAPNGKAHAWKA